MAGRDPSNSSSSSNDVNNNHRTVDSSTKQPSVRPGHS